ncbi:MAG: hypothetical protein COB15_12010 [Flavobacteriales bacterium]|nr:MAG: hypothetical protein COB15_12010 [Flavobacteriales bacterium]
MKKILKSAALLIMLTGSTSLFCQNNSVGIGTLTPDNSAILELESVSQGFLMTRLNTSQINSITAPSEGVIVYNLDDKCYWFQENNSWKRICNTDSLITLINNLGDTIGYIYDSLAVHNTNISNNTSNITLLGDTIGYIYDSLAVHNTNIYNNTTNIQNLSDSLGWVYDSLIVHNNNIFNLFDSISVINNNIGIIDSTLLEKWDLNGNTGTDPNFNFLGTTDNVDLVFRTNNIEKARLLTSGEFGIGTNAPTELLDINSNALRLRNGAILDYVLTTDVNGVGTWQDITTNTTLTPFLTNDWHILGNTGTSATVNFLGTTDSEDLVFRTNNTEKTRLLTSGEFGIGTNAPTELLDINSNALRLRNGATLDYLLTTDINGVGTWQDPSTNSILTPFLTNDWHLTGNSGTTAGINYIGTNDNVDFIVKTNTIQRIIAKGANGYVGIGMGITNPRASLEVTGNGLLVSWDGTGTHIPALGEGQWIMYDNIRNAFRVGRTTVGAEFDLIHRGQGSVGLGIGNKVAGAASSAMGQQNDVSGRSSIGLGAANTITHRGSFVFGTGGISTADYEFVCKFYGGYKFYSNNAITSGVTLAPGSGTWASVSDVTQKTNITELNYNNILAKIKSLKIKKWSYIGQTVSGQDKYITTTNPEGRTIEIPLTNLYEKDIYHVGVMAQDFYKEFGLGEQETTISVLDVAGINTAAIKALLEKIEKLEEIIENLDCK